jgi:hypothetical protein
MRDLDPYICVFDDCKKPHDLFRTFNNWISHIKKEHIPLQWHCTAPGHQPETFPTEEAFIKHMRDAHAGTFTDEELPVFTQISARPATQIFTICPFCARLPDTSAIEDQPNSQGQEALQKHIAEHLQSLALISLPWMDNVGSGVTAIKTSSGRQQDNVSDHWEESPPLVFMDPPNFESSVVDAYVDPQWEVLPGMDDSDDPAWTERSSSGHSHASREQEWGFSKKTSLPPYDGHLKDEKLAAFVERWELDSGLNKLLVAVDFG